MKNREIRKALEKTRILRQPRQLLATFGSSIVKYYILTESICDEMAGNKQLDTVIRRGEIVWEQPRILTPVQILKMEGFSGEAREAIRLLAMEYPNLAGLLYALEYKKKHEEMEIVSNSLIEVLEKIEKEIERKEEPLTTIIKGVAGYWDVSLMKFVQEMIIKSAHFSQLSELREKGFIGVNSGGYFEVIKDKDGKPLATNKKIEEMFDLVKKGELEPVKLKKELDKWGLFEEYEDRFFDLFKDNR